MDKQPTREVIVSVSSAIASVDDYFGLAAELGFSKRDLPHVNHGETHIGWQARDLLLRWCSWKGILATVQALHGALTKIGKADVANYLLGEWLYLRRSISLP